MSRLVIRIQEPGQAAREVELRPEMTIGRHPECQIVLQDPRVSSRHAKFAGDAARSRGSSPKLQVLNTALMTASTGLAPDEMRADREFWGRLVESAVGAHLANAAAARDCELFYWRERNREVDFVVRAGRRLVGIEVKSGRTRGAPAGLSAFSESFRGSRTLLVGEDGTPIEAFLSQPVAQWLRA